MSSKKEVECGSIEVHGSILRPMSSNAHNQGSTKQEHIKYTTTKQVNRTLSNVNNPALPRDLQDTQQNLEGKGTKTSKFL